MRKNQIIFWTICFVIGLGLGFFYNLSKKEQATSEVNLLENAVEKEKGNSEEVLGITVVEGESASLIIDFGDDRIEKFLDCPVEQRISALDLLRLVAEQSGFEIKTEKVSFGEYIQEISGVGGDTTHYWAFWINGDYAPVGAGNYIVRPGDEIEFELTKLE